MGLSRLLLSGIGYSAISKYSSLFVSLGVTAILARNIEPAKFGLVAITTIVISFFQIISNLGIGTAVIQFKDLSERQLDALFTISIIIGTLLTTLFLLGAKPVATFYGDAQLLPVLRWSGIIVFFNSLKIVPNALLFREHQFRFIAIRTLALQVTGGGLAVIWALNGGGVYALLVNPIITAFGMFFLSYIKKFLKINLHFYKESLTPVFQYSSYQAGFEFINFFTRNIDKILLGKYLSMETLGYYEKSYRLMMLPVQNITHVISPVLHPVLSKLNKSPKKLAAVYGRICFLLAAIGFPASVFLFFNSEFLILIFFGENWTEAVPIFKILAISVGFQVVLSSTGAIFQSAGSTKALFITGFISSTVTLLSVLIPLIYWGSGLAVAVGVTTSFVINFAVAFSILYSTVLKSSVVGIFKQFLLPVSLAALFFVSAYYLDNIEALTPLLMFLLSISLLGVFISLIIILKFKVYKLKDLKIKLTQY